MKTVLKVIQEAGGLQPGLCVSIENAPWMRLVIEALPERGPGGHVVVSVAHYGEQNSDLMRDPEMLFEVVEGEGGQPEFWPFYFRNDYVGVEQWSRRRDEAGNLHCLPKRTGAGTVCGDVGPQSARAGIPGGISAEGVRVWANSSTGRE